MLVRRDVLRGANCRVLCIRRLCHALGEVALVYLLAKIWTSWRHALYMTYCDLLCSQAGSDSRGVGKAFSCVCACLFSKSKTAWVIRPNSVEIWSMAGQACIDPDVKRSKHPREAWVYVDTTAHSNGWFLFGCLYIAQSLVWPMVTWYGAESWTLKKHQAEGIKAFEMWCYRRALRVSYIKHVSNDEVLRRIGQSRLLLGKIKSQKLRYFGRVSRHPSAKQNNVRMCAWDSPAKKTVPGWRRRLGWNGTAKGGDIGNGETSVLYRQFVQREVTWFVAVGGRLTAAAAVTCRLFTRVTIACMCNCMRNCGKIQLIDWV